MIIKVSLSKTIQERQFEPIVSSITIEKEVSEKDYKDELTNLRKLVKRETLLLLKEWGISRKKLR